MEKYIHPTAERTVAAAILAGNESAAELIKVVASSDFSSQPLQIIVEATKRLLNGVEPVDTTAIVTEARALVKELKLRVVLTEEFIEELRKTDTRRAPAYAHTVQRYAWLRKFNDMVAWANTELANLPDPEELYKAAQAQLDWLKPPTQGSRVTYGWDTTSYTTLLDARAQERAKGTAIKLDWPWPSWNRFVKLLRPGMVGLLSGPEGSGKTGYLEMIAEHWASKAHVVFVHLENSLEYTLDRRMSRYARLPIELLEDDNLTPEQAAIVEVAEKKIAGFAPQLHYIDASGMSMGEIIAMLRSLKSDGLCDAVVLDYLNKVRASRGQVKLFGTNAFSRQADDLEQFKSFCETPGQKIVGLTAAQYNKEGKKGKGRADGTDIRGSGELMDKVQLAILLQRTILEADRVDATRRTIAHKGQKDPVIKVRVEKQNRGAEVDFEQIHRGEFFTVGDKHV